MYQQISDALQLGKKDVVLELVQEALNSDTSAIDLLNKGLLAGMDIVGQKWKNGEYFLPQVLIAARALTEATKYLEPYLLREGLKPMGKVIIGTVKGDLHDIGKNLVALMLKSKGFEIIDLGTDVGPAKFLEAVRNNPDSRYVCLSALLTTTMPQIAEFMNQLNASGLRKDVVVAIGGAPVTQEYANEVGADVYADDAVNAAEIILSIAQRG
jgi:5-methyltetrahydrofolate--homocysteine methyltransferase